MSFPQYVRLKQIQNEAIKMDQLIRALKKIFSPEELANNAHYQELLKLYNPLKQILPPDYLAGADKRDAGYSIIRRYV